MPLMKFDVIEGRTDAEIKTLLDAAHRAMVAAFKVPERDRYQILQEHKPSRMIVEDTAPRLVLVHAGSTAPTRSWSFRW